MILEGQKKLGLGRGVRILRGEDKANRQAGHNIGKEGRSGGRRGCSSWR